MNGIMKRSVGGASREKYFLIDADRNHHCGKIVTVILRPVTDTLGGALTLRGESI
jgi:hypothetical protein